MKQKTNYSSPYELDGKLPLKTAFPLGLQHPSLTVKKIKHRWNPYSIKVSQRCCFVFKYSLFSLLGHG